MTNMTKNYYKLIFGTMIFLLMLIFFSISYFKNDKPRYLKNDKTKISFKSKYVFEKLPSLNQNIKLGGFSGLYFDKIDNNGADTEGLIKDRDGNFWIVDEYYPPIIKLDNNLQVIKRFASKALISIQKDNPEVHFNYKMEGIAFDGKDRIFIINDNDFGFDSANAKESFILEYKLDQ